MSVTNESEYILVWSECVGWVSHQSRKNSLRKELKRAPRTRLGSPVVIIFQNHRANYAESKIFSLERRIFLLLISDIIMIHMDISIFTQSVTRNQSLSIYQSTTKLWAVIATATAAPIARNAANREQLFSLP